jgi:pyridoxamine 5'-phosphate oxidase
VVPVFNGRSVPGGVLMTEMVYASMSSPLRSNLPLASIRREHPDRSLDEADVDPNPFVQFAQWMEEAMDEGGVEVNAMTLATATPDGIPSARTVLLKGFDERGFVFYSNYESQKGQELAENPHAALLFHWVRLGRQIRVNGTVERTSLEESDAYFHSRPPGSQLSAAVSHQSQVIPSREWLEERLAELEEEYGDDEVPLPSYWGGFRVTPHAMEFWQGRPNRLHDRLRYTLQPDGSWTIERLSP